MIFRFLFNYREDVVLSHDVVFSAITFDFCSGIFAGYYLVADFDGHLDFLPVYEPAGSYRDHLSHLRFFLCRSGKNYPGLCGFFCFNEFNNNSVCKRSERHFYLSFCINCEI